MLQQVSEIGGSGRTSGVENEAIARFVWHRSSAQIAGVALSGVSQAAQGKKHGRPDQARGRLRWSLPRILQRPHPVEGHYSSQARCRRLLQERNGGAQG